MEGHRNKSWMDEEVAARPVMGKFEGVRPRLGSWSAGGGEEEEGRARLGEDPGNPPPGRMAAPAPARDRERPVGQRSSVPKIDKLEGSETRSEINTRDQQSRAQRGPGLCCSKTEERPEIAQNCWRSGF